MADDHQGYRKLEVYRRSRQLSVQIHKMSLGLPKFEMFEVGSQIRRSAQSVPANIVEGFALRNYKQEFIHFLLGLTRLVKKRSSILNFCTKLVR
jgi:hypothetical protein